MHPAAMKDGKLYSQVPHSGDGDFTFSRANGVQTRVNKHGLVETVADNTPRLSYDVVGGEVTECPHLLLEPSRTNYIPYSVFDADVPTGWSVGFGTGTYSHELVYFMGQPAIKHTQFTSGRSYLADSVTLSAGTTYTCSFYVDLENSGDISGSEVIAAISMTGDSGDDEVTFGEIDQDTGLCQFTFTTTVSASCNIRLGFGAFSDSNQLNKPLIFSMPQIEAGEYPTSYIPTSGSTETREAEDSVASLNMTTELTSISEGTLFGELQFFHTDTAVNKNWISIDNGTGTSDDRVMVYLIAGSSIMYGQVKSNSGANVSTLSGRDISDYENVKFALAFKNNYVKLYINGVEEGSSSSYTLDASAFTNVRVGYSGQNEMKLKQLVVFNEALTEAELQTLTS